MATVVGGEIISDPGAGFGNLLSGAGNLFKAIQGQRQQSEDQRLLEQLSQTLSGQGVQPGLAGQPGQPGAVLSPQDKLNEILNVIPQLNRPGNRDLALNLATIQQRAIPTAGAGGDPVQEAIFTDPNGVQRKIRARRSQIEANPNLNFPEVTTQTPSQFEIVQDPLGNRFRIDKLNPQAAPVPIGTTQQPRGAVRPVDQPGTQEAPQVTPEAREPAITVEILDNASGPMSGIRQFFNNTIGFLVPGQIAPKTESAKQQIGLFNQKAKTGLVNNPRFPVAEQKLIDGLLVDPNKFFTDPDANKTKMLNLRNALERMIETKQQAINSGNITREQVQDFTDQNNIIGGILRDIPTREILLGQRGMSVPDIQRLTPQQAQTSLDSMTTEQLRALSPEALRAFQTKLGTGR